MRLATWNVNSLKARLHRVEAWLEDVQPDVVCLQETKLADGAWPAMTFQAMGYESVHHGFNQWNGVAILSRVGIEDPQFGFGDAYEDRDARLVWATCGGIRVASAYVPNGRTLDDDHYQYKLEWLAALRSLIEAQGTAAGPLVVAGDFNIAPADADVYNPAKFTDTTHTSAAERAALAEIEALGLVDTFRQLQPEDRLYSWWDYRAGDFHQHRGMRIDLVLATEQVASRARFATIDRQARKGDKPSDHAPVILDLDDAEAA